MSVSFPAGAREILEQAVVARVATVSSQGRPNLAAFWFHFDGSRLVLYTNDNATASNIRRTGEATVLIDQGVAFGELRGVLIRGTAKAFPYDNAPEPVNDAIACLEARHREEINSPLYKEFQGDGPPASVYVEIIPTSLRYWDFGRKIV